MAVQHEDPVVFNQFSSKFQNASNQQPSGQSIGVTIGQPGGSTVRMAPAVGSTLQIDGGLTATIESAFQMATNAVSENVPAYSCSIVINQGLGNEQIGHFMVSGLASDSCQAVIMLSEAADGSAHGYTKTGTVVSGAGSVTYAFTSLHSVYPKSMIQQFSQGFGLVGTETGGQGNFWRNMVVANGFTTNSTGEYPGQYHFSPLHDGVVFFRGVIITPGSGNVNGVTFTTVLNGFTPAGAGNNARWPVMSLTSPGSLGYAVLNSNGTIIFRGIPSTNNQSIDITGHCHISNNPTG